MAQSLDAGLSVEDTPLVSNQQQHDRIKFQRNRKIVLILIILSAMIVAILLYFHSRDEYSVSTTNKVIGLDGFWPVWGGNLQNQQHSPYSNAQIAMKKLKDLKQQCKYFANGSTYLKGYVTIDETGDYGYFPELTGYVTSIHLDSCDIKWRINIDEILNITNQSSPILISTHGVTLFRNSDGIKGVLISPEQMDSEINMPYTFVFAVNRDKGELLWKTRISPTDGGGNSPIVKLHGFIVDGHYGYIGMSARSTCLCKFRGRVMKIDIDTGELVDTWYTLPEYTGDEIDHDYYAGAAVWGYPGIIDDYLVFGSGNLYELPNYIEQCILNEISNNNDSNPFIPDNNYPFNLCGEDVGDSYPHWKCFDKNIHTDSLNILNKTTMKLIKSMPLSGVDIYKSVCNLWTGQYDPDLCPDQATLGSDSDLVAIVLYKVDTDPFVAAISKAGMFIIVDIANDGDIKFVKKIGPAGIWGGSLYSLAADNDAMIAIVSITGYTWPPIRYQDINGRYICNAGSIYAIDLRTGQTLWQSVNPYGLFDDQCLNNNLYNNYTDWYIDRYGICELSNLDPVEVVNGTHKVIYANLTDDEFLPIDSVERAIHMSPVTIANHMVFVPNMNGDIFVHDLFNGGIIHRIQCDDYYDMDEQAWNRPGILSGVTVVRDRVIFYCGGTYMAHGAWEVQDKADGESLISLNLMPST